MNAGGTKRATAAPLAASALIASLLLAGCAVPRPPGADTQAADSAATRPPVVLAEYEGVLPCADCEGIRTRLALYADSALYRLSESRLGIGTPDSAHVRRGTWTTLHGMEGNPDAIVYQLDPGDPERARSFMVVSDAEILMLDRDQRRLPGEQNYSLLRLPLPVDPLGGRTWMWVELVRGRERAAIDHPERYTIRTRAPGSLAVQADCNHGHARYRMRGTEVAMGPLALTFAMCDEGSRGDEFARLIGEAVRMEVVGDTLKMAARDGAELRLMEMPGPRPME